jgi:ATP-binding protein involved in chromosome partitioning
VIVSTPQDIAMKDATKGINMFLTTKIPIIGMVQNMSLFTCPHCSHSTHIFGHNRGVEKACTDFGVDFLGDVPLHESICDDADRGCPTVVAEPDSVRGKAFMGIAEKVGDKIGLW